MRKRPACRLLENLSLLLAATMLLLAGCAGRAETMRYERETIPAWILEEWANAQKELLELPELPEDPRRFKATSWHWVQLQEAFEYTDADTGERDVAGGLTMFESRQIIVCCGSRETVRHEAFHAILYDMGDGRAKMHYPELRSNDPFTRAIALMVARTEGRRKR